MNNIQNTDHHPRPVLRVANAHRPRRPANRAVQYCALPTRTAPVAPAPVPSQYCELSVRTQEKHPTNRQRVRRILTIF